MTTVGTTVPRLTRRMTMRLLAAGLIAGGSDTEIEFAASTDAVATKIPGTSSSPNPMQDDLVRLFADPRAAAVIGRAYLRGHVAPRPALSTLSAQVTRALQLDDADSGRHDRATLRARLRSRISQDFAEGKVTDVDGWMLSLVEAQACAIAHLSATGVA